MGIFWFAELSDASGMALCKLNFDRLDVVAGLAKYLLESLNEELRRGTLPNTFLDRLSFDLVMKTNSLYTVK